HFAAGDTRVGVTPFKKDLVRQRKPSYAVLAIVGGSGMGKFDPNSLPEGPEIVIETDMIPVIAAINVVDDIPDQAIQGGVCLAMCLKWVESGARNLDFWETLTQDETLNDIRWLHHRERAMRREMARVVGLRLPPSGGIRTR